MDNDTQTTKEKLQRIKEELSWHMRSITLDEECECKENAAKKVIIFKFHI